MDLAAVRGNLNRTLGTFTAAPAAAAAVFSAPAANLSGSGSFAGRRVWVELGSGGWSVEGS